MPNGRDSSEGAAVRELRQLFTNRASRRVARIGIGDDAAVLRPVRGALVWTIDTSVEHVHFRRDWLSLREIGERAFHAAASDLAAMGARPLAALANITVPKSNAVRVTAELARGQAKAAKALSCPVIGGNLSRGHELSVTTAVLGVARQPLARTGAKPGDELWLIGDVGLAGAGRRCLERGATARTVVRGKARAVRAFRSPEARIQEGLRLVGRARAAIDVSDGLAVDASRLAEASAVRIVIDADQLNAALAPELLLVAAALGRPAIEFALYGGEDYALLAAGPRARRPRFARRIGRIERGRGISMNAPRGLRRLLRNGPGFDHFA